MIISVDVGVGDIDHLFMDGDCRKPDSGLAQMNSLDWSLLRSFLTVAECGSLSSAAARIGATQPTLSRHIREMEAALGVTLFTRTPRGLDPTPAALDLLEDARAMGRAASALALKAEGRSERLSGTVRITTSVVVANLLLPALLSGFRRAEPDIQIEIVASDQSQNLLSRDADIAIRMVDPTQQALVARKLGVTRIGLFGARSYLERRGRPEHKEDLLHHDVIGFDRGDGIVNSYADNGLSVTRDNFPIRCDDQMVAWNLLLAGAGLGFAQVILAEAKSELNPLDLDYAIPPLPVWLVLHEEVRANPRIRRVADYLSDGLARQLQDAK